MLALSQVTDKIPQDQGGSSSATTHASDISYYSYSSFEEDKMEESDSREEISKKD